MHILVVGATDVLGRNVVPRLQERGHEVRALVRRAEQAAALRRLGAEAVTGDILDLESLLNAASGCDAALHLATVIPKPGGAQDWSGNDQVRREGTRNLLAAAEQAGVHRYVQQSITLLYGDQDDRIVDESTPLQPASHLKSAADMEALVQASSLDWCILRGGSFYGQGTGQEARWFQAAREGILHLPGSGTSLLSLIHVADMARAIVLAVESAPPRSLFNVVDDTPVSYRELYAHVAILAGARHTTPGDAPVPSLGCDNTRLKEALGWTPAYPSYRSGLATAPHQ